MRNCILLIIIFNFLFASSNAQNLVSNPGFEDLDTCPNFLGQIERSVGWMSFNFSPDYFNRCATSCPVTIGDCVGIPQNFFGSQDAYEGNAYSGLYTYVEGGGQQREIIGTHLIQPLTPGIKYFVSCYICNAGGYSFFPHRVNDGSSNNFGFRFFMHSYTWNNPCPMDNFSQVHESNIITDSVKWTKISGSFIADSAYEYLALGNFYDDIHTDTLNIADSDTIFINAAYYFIDNVCVSQDSMECNLDNSVNENNEQSRIKIYPNPFNEKLTLESELNEDLEIIIYDFSFRKILNQKFTHSILINTMLLQKGIYFYQVKNKITKIKMGKIIKQ